MTDWSQMWHAWAQHTLMDCAQAYALTDLNDLQKTAWLIYIAHLQYEYHNPVPDELSQAFAWLAFMVLSYAEQDQFKKDTKNLLKYFSHMDRSIFSLDVCNKYLNGVESAIGQCTKFLYNPGHSHAVVQKLLQDILQHHELLDTIDPQTTGDFLSTIFKLGRKSKFHNKHCKYIATIVHLLSCKEHLIVNPEQTSQMLGD